jgi:3-mercaptopyruvate sulfurtransferase SseA
VAARWAGYMDLRIYQAGYPEWVEKGYPVEKGVK